jgi:hypothetical protein
MLKVLTAFPQQAGQGPAASLQVNNFKNLSMVTYKKSVFLLFE